MVYFTPIQKSLLALLLKNKEVKIYLCGTAIKKYRQGYYGCPTSTFNSLKNRGFIDKVGPNVYSISTLGKFVA